MNVSIKTIPHKEQRYPTCGDWWFEGENLEIRVSSMNNWIFEFFIAVHELIEAGLCKMRGIKQEDVDAFDKRFEEDRDFLPMDFTGMEPGDSPLAPYHKEHIFSTKIEKRLLKEFRRTDKTITWKQYNKVVNEL